MLKTKWKSIKDKYRKELKKIPKSKSGSDGSVASYKPTWKYFSMCGFLDNIFLPGSDSGNLDKRSSSSPGYSGGTKRTVSDDTEHSDCDLEDDDTESLSSSISSICAKPSTDVTLLRPYKKKKPTSIDIGSEMLNLERQKLSLIESGLKGKSEISDDPDVQFLTSLVPYIKDLNAFDRLQVRQRIQQVVLDAFKNRSDVIYVSTTDS